MKLIGLCGLARSGKDTVGRMLTSHHSYHPMSFAHPLKIVCAQLLHLPFDRMTEGDRDAILPEWGFSIRWFLQRVGTECFRQQIRDDFWIKCAEVSMSTFPDSTRVVFTDVRFENEARMIRDRGGLLIHIQRNEAEKNRMNHVSEAGVTLTEQDVILPNNGTLDDLFRNLTSILARYKYI